MNLTHQSNMTDMYLALLLVIIHVDEWTVVKLLERVCKAYLEASLKRSSISHNGRMRPYVLFRYPNLKTLKSIMTVKDNSDIDTLEVAYNGQFISHVIISDNQYRPRHITDMLSWISYPFNVSVDQCQHIINLLTRTSHPLNISNKSVHIKIVGNQVYFKHINRDRHWDRMVDLTLECMGPNVDVTFINDELEYPDSKMKSLTFLEPRFKEGWIDIIEDMLINYVSTTITFRWYDEIDKEQYEEFIKLSSDKLIARVKWEVIEENDNPS